MDTTEENEESDESFEIIPDTNDVHGEMENFSAEDFSYSLIAVSINTEYSTTKIKEDNNDDEKNISVKSEPLNESSVSQVLNQNLGKGSNTDTSVTHTLDISNHQLLKHTQEGNVSTIHITNSDRKNDKGKHADSQPNQFTEVLSQEKTQDTDRNISQNNNQNKSATYMKQSERMNIKFKINAAAESIASNLKYVNNKTDDDKHFIAVIDVEKDNKYTQNKDQNAHASNTMSTQIIDTDTGERNDNERTNSKLGKLNQKTFLEQEKHQSVTLDEKRDKPPATLELELSVDNECIDIESSREPQENNYFVTHCDPEETLTKQNQDEKKEDVSKENRHDNALPIGEPIANKAIENFQRSSDHTKINQLQIESLKQQDDYNDELEQYKAVELYQRASRDMENNKSPVDHLDIKDQCKEKCDKEDTAASTKNQRTLKSKENNPSEIEDLHDHFTESDQADVYLFHTDKRNDSDMTSDTVSRTYWSESDQDFPIKTSGSDQGELKQDNTNLKILLEYYTPLSEENRQVYLTKMLQNSNMSVRSLIADKLQNESNDEVGNDLKDYKPNKTDQVKSKQDHTDHRTDKTQNSNQSFKSFSTDNLQCKSKQDVEDLSNYDSGNMETASLLDKHGHGMNTIQNTSSKKSNAAEELQHYSGETINCQTVQKSNLTFYDPNTDCAINIADHKVKDEDKENTLQHRSNYTKEDLLPIVSNENLDRKYFIEKRFRLEGDGAFTEDMYEENEIMRKYWISYRILMTSDITISVLEKDLEELNVTVGINQASQNPCIFFPVFKDRVEMEESNKSVMRILVQNVRKYIGRCVLHCDKDYDQAVLNYINGSSEILNNEVVISHSHEEKGASGQLEIVGIRGHIPLALHHILDRFGGKGNMRLFDADGSFEVEINKVIPSECHFDIFQMLDINLNFARDYSKSIVQANDKEKSFYVLDPIGESTSAKAALVSGEWLNQIPHDRFQMHPFLLTLLQHSEASQFIHRKLKMQTGKYAWLYNDDNSLVVYGESSTLVSFVITTIKSSLIKETISVLNTEKNTKFIKSSDWQGRSEMICSRYTGKIAIHTEYETSGSIFITIVGTNDLILNINDLLTETKDIMVDFPKKQPMTTEKFSQTVKMDPYQFRYSCKFVLNALLESRCSRNVEILQLDNDKQTGFIVSGYDSEIVSEISSKIFEKAKHIIRKLQLINQRVAILTMEKSNYGILKSIATRYNCLISVDITENPDLPILRVEPDHVSTRDSWFMENGCEICLTLKEPELCQCDVIVEQGEQEGIQARAVRVSPESGLLKQVVIKIHLNWEDGKNGEKDKLHKLLQNVFLTATSLGHRSFAFLVHNFCGWPNITFCKCLIFSLKKFHDEAIDKVYFCCQDEDVCEKIRRVFEDADYKDFPLQTEKISISIVEGDMAMQKVDAIVNTTGRQLDLNNGAVSKSICNSAGNGMQEEIKKNYPYGIEYGDIAVTQCYRLGCKNVLHCALYAWSGNAEEQKKCLEILKMCITQCLLEANKRQHKTIAFPVLGTGNLNVPVKIAAKSMIDSIKEYEISQSNTSIINVKIIVYKDKQILKTFNEILQQRKAGQKTEPKRTIQQEKCLINDLPPYKSPMTIEIIGHKDSIQDIVAEIESFEKFPRQALNQYRVHSKVEQTDPSTNDARLPISSNSVNAKDCSSEKQHRPQRFDKFQKLSLVKTEDVRRYLLATKLTKVQNVKCVIKKELTSKQCQPCHILYPYKAPAVALITCNCREDAEYIVKQSFETFEVEELPAQILCNMEAELDPVFFPFIPSTENKGLLKKRLIEQSGVIISNTDERETWTLKGLCFQIETALNILEEYVNTTVGGFNQDLNSQPELFNDAAEKSADDSACISKYQETNRSHDGQDKTAPYNTVIKYGDCKEPVQSNIATKKVENVSLEEYREFQCFFPKDFFARDNGTIDYNVETCTINITCEGQNIETVFETVRRHVSILKSYTRENVPYQQDNKAILTSVEGEICETFPGLFYYNFEERKEIRLLGKNPNDVSNAKCRIKVLLGETLDLSNVSNNACQAAIQSFGNIKNAKVFITAEGLQIYVYQASILNLQVECIVNAANCKLDHGGGVAYAISRASGEIIEKESKGLIRKYGELEVGKACYTRAGKLKYKYVIHTVGPRWSDYKTKQESERQRCATDLERAIQSAVNKADQLRMSSIGIPPVSAGTYGVPKEICANSYASAVISKMTTKSTLKEVHFIDKDFEMVQLITDVFREFFTEHSPVCINNFQSLAGERQIFSKLSNEFQTLPSQQERHPQQFYPVHREDHSSGTFIHEFQLSTKLKLCVYTKAFETVNVQALVCGQDIHFENKGAVAEGIRKAAGMLYDIYLAEARKQKKTFNIGEVVCLQEGIKYVLHVVAPKWKTKGGNKQTFLTGISKCYANVLMQAVELGINTIAVPLLGAGSKGSPTKAIAENLLKEILSLVHKVGTSCSINEIHVVNKNPDTTKVVVTLFDKHVSSEWKRLTAEEAQA